MLLTKDVRAEPAVHPALAFALHAELTDDGTRIVLMAAGNDYQAACAAKLLNFATPLIKPTTPPGALSLPCSWPAVVQLANLFGPAWRPGPRLTAWVADEISRRTADAPESLDVPLPDGLTPRPYQVTGAHMIALIGKVLITDEPGTGKTITTILGLLNRSQTATTVLPIVVVCPASVVDPWVDAWRAWAPHLTTVAWRGTPAKRRTLAGTADVYVTSYDTARRDAGPGPQPGPLLALRPAAVVIDECHLLKNPHSGRSHAVRRLAKNAGTVVALSGTPITHHPGDLWPTLVALEPHAWPSRERWVNRYCQTASGDYSDDVLGLEPAREAEFRTTLLGAHRRVAKADVLTQLPPKVYSVRTVALPPAYRQAYDAMEKRMLAELPDGTELSVMSVLAKLTRLAQLASAAADVTVTTEIDDNGEEREHQHVALKAPSWKVDALLEVLDERPGQPVVAFSPSRQLMTLGGALATKAGHKVGYIIGGQTPRDRTDTVRRFQAGELDLVCATTGAGGVGITLTAARTVVFLQRPWSLVEALQAEDRCFGAGTPVLTPRGWVPIEDIAIGDTVVTHTGAVQPVIDAWSQQSTRPMAEVAITGQETVTCTADHRFLRADGTWCEAQELRPGDWLAVPGNDVHDTLSEVPFDAYRVPSTLRNSWGAAQRNGRLKRAADTIAVTDDFLYALGYFAGDGFASITEGKGRFVSFSGNPTSKVAALDRCERWAHSVGLTGKRRATERSRSVEQRFYSADWAYWFHQQFGGRTGARHKQLPAFVLTLNVHQSRVVLDGLADSDGYRRPGKSRCEYVTVSPTLAANVAHLAMRAGYRPSLTTGSTGQFIVSFGRSTGPRSPGRVRSVLLRHPAKLGGVKERVYDLTIRDAETFVVGGVVVHNCHRLGSERHDSIEVIDIVAANTIDSRVRAVLHAKAGQLADLLQDPRIVAELLGGDTSARELRKAS